MNEPGNEERIARQAKELFDDSVETLDAATLSRLNRGRHKALAELQKPAGIIKWGGWLPATGVAAAVLVTVLVVRGTADLDLMEETVTASDFEMLLEEDSLEMFEDLEFYALLDEVDLEANGDVG
ncbi:MAG: hypothetical protein OEM60_00340 [Gammaproteobacteria bacterium]|nr:hypothetical protein [Gammaproteobacteria bacterium]MDH3432278.1 hypothetical protein [Gammaproteobacteria bacterium]